MRKGRKGSSFDSFLEKEGLLEEAEAIAAKRVLAYEVKEFMERKQLTKSQFAEKMRTSRAALDRLLDPDNTSVTLHTLTKAAYALGKRLHFSLEPHDKAL